MLPVIQVILQSISSFAIAASLIYAAVQFRNTRRATHVANFTRLVELQMKLRQMRVDDPGLARIYEHDVVELANDDEIRAHFMNLMQLSVFEIVWFSHKHGQLPDDYFESWKSRMRWIFCEKSFRKMMTSPNMKILHDEFQALVLKMMAEPPPKAAIASIPKPNVPNARP